MLVVNGLRAHYDLGFLRWCKEHHIFVVIRWPHSLNISQGEDVSNYATLKPKYSLRKTQRLQHKVRQLCEHGQHGYQRTPRLGLEDFPACITGPWEESFKPVCV